MVNIRLTRRFIVRNAVDLDATTDAVTDALIDLEGEDLGDADMAADLGASTVELSITARAATLNKACAKADSAIRAAIHAAGGATPGWQTPVLPTTPVFEQAEEDLVEPVAA